MSMMGPLCRGHHQAGNEIARWESSSINALGIAKRLWEESHARAKPIGEENTRYDAGGSIVKGSGDSLSAKR